MPQAFEHNDLRDRSAARPLIRILDLAFAVFGLVIVGPLLLLIAIAIVRIDNGPPLFMHRRYGRGGRTFLCYKFRTMPVNADALLMRVLQNDAAAREEWTRDHKLRQDPRITPIGRFLRTTSLDELPQLLNVLRGDMSLVGPRPIVAGEVGRYGSRYRHYCSVRPGITGIWQIGGRNDVSYRRRVAMDCLMARRLSPLLYLAILAGTAQSVVMRRGAY